MKLDIIREEIQKVAEAISLVLKIDVTIVNEEMKRIAGTGIYKEKIGETIAGYSAFRKSFIDKKTLIIDDPIVSIICRNCDRKGNCEEKGELCCPIVLEGKCYGVIGLIAFDEKQKDLIANGKKNLILFMEKMADLISGNIKAEIKSNDYNVEKEKIMKVLDGMNKPVVSTDENGIIDSYNSRFTKVFNIKVDPRGKNIYEVLDFFDDSIFRSMENRDRKSDMFYSRKNDIGGIYTINRIFYKSVVRGFVIDFVDKKDAIQNYNRMNVDYRMTLGDIIGTSKAINKIKSEAKMASKSTSTVLITGESGTGKEMFARAIHSHSMRKDKPFITINCAAIPGELLESELFGYEEGAFTGARKGGKLGMFEIANKGTIFLDEVGDMSLHLQAKLLRVLQEKEIRKVGGKQSIKVDVRIISATNKDLIRMVENGLFREDLYYRLNVIPLNLPSLRDRKEDIPLLVNHMLKLYSEKLGKKIYSVSDEVMDILEKYEWPGNIRELQNVIEYCVNISEGSEIDDVDMLMRRVGLYSVDTPSKKYGAEESGKEDRQENSEIRTLEDIEKEEIEKALEIYGKYKGDKEIVAEKLGISKATLYRKIKKYNL